MSLLRGTPPQKKEGLFLRSAHLFFNAYFFVQFSKLTMSYTLLVNVAPKSTSYHHKYLKIKQLQPCHVGNNKKGLMVPIGCFRTSGHNFIGCIGLAKYIILKPEAENFSPALQQK